MVDKKQCTGNVDECFKCGMYYTSHSSHRESGYTNEVITISCCFGTAGTFDGNTGERLESR